MSDPTPKGPSGSASWEARRTGEGHARPLTVLLTPDAANDELAASGRRRVYYCLPEAPLLARDGAGDPVFSLTLVLSRQPNPDDETIAPLIEQGVLSFDVTLAVPTEAYTDLRDTEDAEYRPLFAREAAFGIVTDGRDQAVGEASASGANTRVALSATLGRPETLDVLSALDGVEARTALRAKTTYSAIAAERTVRLCGSWADVHDFLSAHLDTSGQVERSQLRACFAGMLKAEILCVFDISSSGHEERVLDPDPAPFFDAFMQNSFVVLERLTPELEPRNEENRYGLRARPDPTFYLNHKQKLGGFQERSVSLDAPLDEIIGGALEGQDRSRFIQLVCPRTGDGAGFGPAPRRVRISGSGLRDARGHEGPGEVQLALVNGVAQSVAQALRPSATTAEPRALLASDMIEPAGTVGNARYWWVDDVRFAPRAQPRNLPVVERLDAPVWPDRLRPSRYWYAPSFKVVESSSSVAPRSGPFCTTSERSGDGPSSKPARIDQVQFTLRKVMSSEADSALQGIEYEEAHPVPLANISASLELPLVDGRANSGALVGNVSHEGDEIRVTVDMTEESALSCHRALTRSDPRLGPARLRVSYAIETYVPLGRSMPIVGTGAVSRTPIVYSEAQAAAVSGTPYFDAANTAYRYPGGEVRFERETASSGTLASTSEAPLDGQLAASLTASFQPARIARPPLESLKCLGDLTSKNESELYAQRTLVRVERLRLAFPRNIPSASYLERHTNRNSLTLREGGSGSQGSTFYGTRGTEYEEVDLTVPYDHWCTPAPNTSKYCHIYRSLQQPTRFLIVPTYYRITRYEPSVEGKAYRPAVIVYASIHPQDPAQNRYIFQMALQPDLPTYIRRDLLHRVREKFGWSYKDGPEYSFEYPTEITDARTEYTGIVFEGVTINAARMPDSLQLTLSTDLQGALATKALLENTGLYGNVRFTLPDGSVLESALALELAYIAGPLEKGPVEYLVTFDGDPFEGDPVYLTVTNKIERAINVDASYEWNPSSIEGEDCMRYPLGFSVAPGSSTGALPYYNASRHVDEYLEYSLNVSGSVKLEEIRCFVEDVNTNVIFVDQVNYSDHGLESLEVQAQIKDVAGTKAVPMSGDPPSGEATFVLPLTTYLEKHVLQFQVTKSFTSGKVQSTPWLEWDLGKSGIVRLTWDMIA